MNKITYVVAIILIVFVVIFSSCIKHEKELGKNETISTKQKQKNIEITENISKDRAISLKVLQEKTKECMPKGSCADNINKLEGINKISGYVIDEKNKDLIIIGEIDNTSPSLYLEDFVIALRNAWMIYAPLKGNTYYYSSPGVSIDPDPKVLYKLQQTSDEQISDSEDIQKKLEKWQNLCSQPQQVRVMGVPEKSRFANVMIDADYYMKRLVDGSVTLEIKGFRSYTDMASSIARKDMELGKPVSIPLGSLNRFWFFPGENKFLEDKGIVYIEKSDVKLLTEEEFLTENKEIAGSNKQNPIAGEFADSFSTKYSEIARIRPVYSELEDLFRFMGLVNVIKYRGAVSEAGINLDYFLYDYPVKKIESNSTLPGISNVKEFQHKEEFAGGSSIASLWFMSCGGVSIDISVRETSISKDKNGVLDQTRENILETRSFNSLSWEILIPKSLKYNELYISKKYPEIIDKRTLLFNKKDESTIQLEIFGENIEKSENVKISTTLNEFINKWNMADDKTKSLYLKNEKYLRELLPFLKKIDDAAERNEIILDMGEFREYSDIFNLYFGSKIEIASKRAVPEKIAQTLVWNEKTKFTPSNIIVVYSANPKYSKEKQEERKEEWKKWIEEINKKIIGKIKLEIVESPDKLFQEINEVKDKGVVVIRVGETGTDGYTIMPEGKFNAKDIEMNVVDNQKRVSVFANCCSIYSDYAEAGSSTGSGINLVTTKEVPDKETIMEFLKLSAIELETNNGNLLKAFEHAIDEMPRGSNYEFIKFAMEYYKKDPQDISGAIIYANDKLVELQKGGPPEVGNTGIQIVIDSRGIGNG